MKEKIKKLGKKLLILLLIIIIIFGALVTTYQIRYNFKAKINDYTNNASAKAYSEEVKKLREEYEDVGLLSSGVEIFTEEENNQINESITQTNQLSDGTVEIILKNDVNDKIKNLTKGEIFCLGGDETTPLQTTFFGKVLSNKQTEDAVILTTESPNVDEIFDMLSIETNQVLTAENIKSIKPMEGVNVAYVSADNQVIETVENGNGEIKIDNLTNLKFEDNNMATQVNDEIGVGKISVEADLTSVLEKLAKKELGKEFNEYASIDPVFKVSLAIDFKTIEIGNKFDFDLSGLHDCYVNIKDEFDVQAKVNLGVKGEIEGETTVQKTGICNLYGLEQKLFPIFYMDLGTQIPITIANTKDITRSINSVRSIAPASVGIMFYVDFQGNITLGATLEYKHESKTERKINIVENDEWKLSDEKVSEYKSNSVTISGQLKFSGDLNTGFDVMLNVGSANILDIALIKLGLETEASGKLSAGIEWVNGKMNEDHLDASLTGHLRLYLKVIDISLKFKVKNKFIPITFQTQLAIVDLTLLEIGEKKSTSYNKDTMKVGQVSAEDSKNNYYKTSYYELIKETKDSKEKVAIYTNKFDQICAIDETYIYVTSFSSDGSCSIIRVKKDGEFYKTMVKDVSRVLTQDDNYIYYISNGEERAIYMLNRETEKTEQFMKFDYDVQLMLENEDGTFYIITQDDSLGLAFLGMSSNYYYVVGKDQTIINDYGEQPTVDQYYINSEGQYYEATKFMAYGRTRSTAANVVFMNSDKSIRVEAETDSGWASKKQGIVTQKDRSDSGYDLNIYSVPNGELKTIMTVQSRYAMFTIAEAESGEWYFFDQVGEKVILYKLDATLTNKTIIKEFAEEEFRCNMEKCSIEMTNNVLYFYQIENNDTKVLYRYDLNLEKGI